MKSELMVKGRFPFREPPDYKKMTKQSGWRCDGIGAGWWEETIRDSEIENARDDKINDSALPKVKSRTA